MNHSIIENRESISRWILLVFVAIMVIGFAISEFFQAPTRTSQEFEQYQLLFNEGELSDIQRLTIKNRLGAYDIQKQENSDKWNVISPRKHPATPEAIGKIFDSLAATKIRKIFQQDPINIANFSLDDPLVELLLFDSTGAAKTIQMGLINPIDNSTYILLPDKDVIYQVNTFLHPIETFDLTDIIESRVFPLNIERLQALKIYKGDMDRKDVRLNVMKSDKKWVGERGQELRRENVDELVKRLGEVNIKIILDKATEAQQKRIDEYLKSPEYSVEINEGDQKSQFIITRSVYSIPDVKIEKNKTFLIKKVGSSSIFVVDREHKNIFRLQQKRLENLPFKKLFY